MRRSVPLAFVVAFSLAVLPLSSAETPGEPAWRAELRAQRVADPGDLGTAYFAAYLAADGGDSDGALQILEGLEPADWAYPLPESDFPKLAALPRFQQLAGRLAARAPRGGPAKLAFSVGPADLLPEGIACDPRSGAVFLGSRKHRKIVRVDRGQGTPSRDFVAARADLGAVLGLHVDAPRRLLWAAHNPRGKAERAAGQPRSGIIGIDIESGAVKHAASLDGPHLLNDIAVAGNGDVYVTDSEPGSVWRLPAAGTALERVVADGTFMYPNGVVWLEERQELIVADVTGLHLLEPGSGARRRVARGPAKTLGGVDGLVLLGDRLIAVQNGYTGERVVGWRLDRERRAVVAETVLQSWDPSFAVPTTACVRDGQVLFIANSYAGQSDEYGNPKDPTKLRPAEILAVPCTEDCRPGGSSMKPDFDAALQEHFAAISNRDIEAFASHLTRGETLYTIVQNGHAFTTPAETIEIHRQWFADPDWTWEGTVVHKVVGEDLAMALVKYEYRPRPGAEAFTTWLTYVFQLQEGHWRIVHDQNTALDYSAFARATGTESK